jgi:hypothetical protein
MTDAPRLEITAASAPARRAQVYTEVLDGEAVLYDVRADRLHLLNHTTTLLWELFDGRVQLGDLAREIADEFGTAADVVLADLVSVTTLLAELGVLEGRDAEPDGTAP